MGAEHPGARIDAAEPLTGEACPQPPCSTELRDLLEEVVVDVEEERQARRDAVDIDAALARPLEVGDPGAECERHLLYRGRPGVANVVAADVDRIEQGH